MASDDASPKESEILGERQGRGKPRQKAEKWFGEKGLPGEPLELRPLEKLVRAIVLEHHGDRQMRHPAAFRLAVEALAMNLAADPKRLLNVPRSGWPRHRCRPEVYGDHFIHALDSMASPKVDLIEQVSLGGS